MGQLIVIMKFIINELISYFLRFELYPTVKGTEEVYLLKKTADI